ncbi:PE family protein [Mycobacterium sp. UM_CSW]|uniref:PE family protein n=1 Tax=Mycobacterium sp. UM_CSW TaxID=1370119 RepID=UPI00082EA740|nr:PE family protein [Mycobacterium sp. UM_CSW]
MSYVIADPEMMTAAAGDLAAIGLNVNAAHMVAAAPTVAVIPAAADEVSTGIAHLFSQHAANYQALAGQAAASYEQFAQHLTASAGAYASAEDAIAALLQNNLLSEIATGWSAFLATLPEGSLETALLLLLGVISIPFLFALGILLLGVVLPLAIAIFLPLGIVFPWAFVGLVVGGFILGSLSESLAAL